ncbi:MAG: sigma-70 family RNA polymerase sigma factor [Candidatus Moranbacteria bacterium]|nr:sigma-70 family RNA polymerase sigma factor [Candidatus Moranbacteria bacterium]
MKVDLAKSSDEDLVKKVVENPDHLTFLVDRYWQKLFWFVKRMSYFSSEDIEDILQEVFIKVYKNINSFDDSYRFSTWVFQITRNTTIDAIRKNSVRPQEVGLEQDDLKMIFSENGIGIEEQMINKEKLKKAEKIINSLPLKYREVMILKFLEEKNYEEIMDIVKKPKGTVASLLNRGKTIFLEKAKTQKLILDI